MTGLDAETPRSLCYRTWLISALMTAVVLHIHYSAFLVTILASQSVSLPLRNLEELYRDGVYSFGLEKGTFIESSFKVI